MVLIICYQRSHCDEGWQVSVPLRGLWFLSSLTKSMKTPRGSFRPLTGIMVLIRNMVTYNQRKGKHVSVPLRGLWFLSICWLISSVGRLPCFRPLTGIMVLIRTPYKWLHSAIENAFCGADFLFSSFFTFLWKMIFKNCPIADF